MITRRTLLASLVANPRRLVGPGTCPAKHELMQKARQHALASRRHDLARTFYEALAHERFEDAAISMAEYREIEDGPRAELERMLEDAKITELRATCYDA